jgi:fused
MLPRGAFSKQFVEAGGVAPFAARLLTDPDNRPGLLVDALLILSNLARISAEFYEPLNNADFYFNLRALLAHTDAAVRYRACNLVGNLCRHSGYFYGHLARWRGGGGFVALTIFCF